MNASCNLNTEAKQTRTAPADYSYISPSVNIYESKDNYVLEADVPGVTKEGLEISVEGSTLTFTGRRDKIDLKAEPLYSELSGASYRRVFELDPQIDTAKIAAKLDQGVLTLTLPKAEQVKPRKVAVNV